MPFLDGNSVSLYDSAVEACWTRATDEPQSDVGGYRATRPAASLCRDARSGPRLVGADWGTKRIRRAASGGEHGRIVAVSVTPAQRGAG